MNFVKTLGLSSALGLSVFLWLNGGHFSPVVARAQSQVETRLEAGKTITRDLKGGEVASYPVRLEPGGMLDAVAVQKGIDVTLRLIGPDGKPLVEAVSRRGAEDETARIGFISNADADYRLEVVAFEKDARPGKFDLSLLELRQASENDRLRIKARGLFGQAVAQAEARKFDAALPKAEESVLLFERVLGSDHLETASAVNVLAQILQAKQEYAKAEPLFLRALAIREKQLGADHRDVAWSRNNLGLFYKTRGDFGKADPYYQQAIAMLERQPGADRLNLAEFLNNLAVLNRVRGDYAKAEPLYLRSLAIRESELPADHLDIALSLNNLALLYNYRGDYAKAEPLFLRSQAIYEKRYGKDHPDVAAALNNLALLYKSMGNYPQAEPLYLRALAIKEKQWGPDHPDVALSLNNLATLYQATEAYDKAEPLLRRALAIREKSLGPEHPLVGTSLINLALVYLLKGDLEKAEPLFARGVAVFEKQAPDHPQLAIGLNNWGGKYLMAGDFRKAEALMLRSFDMRERVLNADHPDVANSLVNLARLYRVMGNPSKAVTYATRANAVMERDFLRNLVAGSEQQKVLYLKRTATYADTTISLHVGSAPNDPEAAKAALSVILQRKGRALDIMSRNIEALRARATPEDRALLDELAVTQTKLANLLVRVPEGKAAQGYKDQVTALETQVDKLQADIGARSASFRLQSLPVTLDAVQRAVPEDAALVEFAFFRPYDAAMNTYGAPRFVAYVLNHTGDPKWVDLGEAGPIQSAIERLRQSFTIADAEAKRDLRPLARAVDQLVMEPVRRLLGDRKRLLISPDGVLNLVPFAALVDENNQYLVERYSMSYLSSGRDLLRLQEKTGQPSPPLVFADPDFGAASGPSLGLLAGITISRLPVTAVEAAAIRRIFPDAKVRQRAEATETALKAVHGPRILHVATHGFFFKAETEAPEPEAMAGANRKLTHGPESAGPTWTQLNQPLVQSGLVMAGVNLRRAETGDDGVFTAMEAAGLDLFGTELVTLSACDSGVGEIRTGDGVYGLRRALVLAGSETQMISLWPVSDRGTGELMAKYYTLLKAGEGRGEALRNVQLAMLKDPRRRHPYYWASFIQSGEWANMAGKR